MKALAPICMFALLTSLPAIGQSLVDGPVAAGMGHAGTALSGDHWADANPALSASVTGRAVGLFVSQAYGLDELRFSSFRYVEPTAFGSFGINVRTFGFEDFRDTRAGLDYAHGFGLGSTRTFNVGVRLNYYQFSISNYGRASTVGISAGGLTNLLPTLHLGFAATNLNQPEIAGSNLDRNLSVGLLYEASDIMRFSADVVKEVRYPVSFRGGIEVQPVEALALRTGATTNPTRFTAAVDINISRVTASFVSERHENLGWSPAAGLSILW